MSFAMPSHVPWSCVGEKTLMTCIANMKSCGVLDVVFLASRVFDHGFGMTSRHEFGIAVEVHDLIWHFARSRGSHNCLKHVPVNEHSVVEQHTCSNAMRSAASGCFFVALERQL
jgi:hypothetical protein